MKRFAIAALLVAATFAVACAEETKTTDASKKPAPGLAKAATHTTQDKAMLQIDQQVQAAKVDKSKPNWRTTLTKPAAATFDADHKYFVNMTTTKGKVVIRMLPETAPMHVTSFLYLTRLGYYDGLAFHRVIPGFMAQGGCPLGTGTGGPGYQFAGEFSEAVKHDKGGLLSMANAGPGTDGSQFFLTFVATPWLNGKHTIFGEVVEGMEVVKALEVVGSPSGKTSEPLKMEKVTVEVK